MSYIFNLICKLFVSINDVFMAMDTTQWGILSAVMVIVGFAALRTKL
jgi:hypothetical protein